MNLWKNRNFSVMLLKEVDNVFNSNDYIYEIKFDGIRACIFVNHNSIKIISRNNRDITYLYPELENIKSLFNKDTILDGEIIIMDKGKISFEKLQERSHLKDKNKIIKCANQNPVLYVAFDILYKNKNLIDLNLLDRKKILNKIKENDYLIKSKAYNNGIDLLNFVKKKHMEGIIAKKKDSIYEINTRSNSWLKIKNYNVGEFIIGGYELKKDNYISLKLGELKKEKLFYVGSVSLVKSNNLYKKIVKLKKKKKSNFENYSENIIYIEPFLKCKIKYIEKTKNNQLRQPIIVKE